MHEDGLQYESFPIRFGQHNHTRGAGKPKLGKGLSQLEKREELLETVPEGKDLQWEGVWWVSESMKLHVCRGEDIWVVEQWRLIAQEELMQICED